MALFMDKGLARRLERTEAAINASFIAARIELIRSRAAAGGSALSDEGGPEGDLAWRDFGGTYAMFDGPESPMTQTFGLGLFEPTSDGDLATIEAFYRARKGPVLHEVSPLAGVQTFALLAERGYRPVELSTVLAQPIDDALVLPEVNSALHVRVAGADELAVWTEVSVLGWAMDPGQADHVRAIAEVAFLNPSITSFFVEVNGRPVATGSLGAHEGVALLAGASTIPGARGRGAQQALLSARLAEARRRGCDVAMMAAEPGSTSQRNAERNGFRVAYTRTKWKLAA
jgi:GNAT superfamily N-acetyltransferase